MKKMLVSLIRQIGLTENKNKHSLMLFIILFTSLFSPSRLRAEPLINGICYSLDWEDMTATVIEYFMHDECQEQIGYSGDIIIPDICMFDENSRFRVTRIGDYAFDGCSELISVSIPRSIESIGEDAFKACSNLSSIKVDSNNPFYDSRDNCNAIIETSSNTLIVGCKNTVIPNSVATIGNYAFYECDGLVSVSIPYGVTTIGVSAFEACSNLNTLIISSSVTTIEDDAFAQCNELYSVELGNSVNNIGKGAFCYCYKLRDIKLPNSLTSIGDVAFRNCEIESVTIPSSVTYLGLNPFMYNQSLKSIKVERGNTHYDSREDCNAIIETSTNTISSGSGDAIIMDGVKRIGPYAFCGIRNFQTITIPNSITYIDTGSFFDTNITSITIGNNVTAIGIGAFESCSYLKSLIIPKSVTDIGNWALSGCRSLKTLYVECTMPPLVGGEFTFDKVDKNDCILYVPKNCKTAYENAPGWKEFFNIVEIDFNSLDSVEQDSDIASSIYDIQGRMQNKDSRHQLIIKNGQKVIYK